MLKLLKYRELIKILVISDLKVRYQGSIVGVAWSLFSPLLLMLVLYLVFSTMFQKGNFALYILTGIITWRYFQLGTTMTMTSLVSKSGLVTKVALPREVLVLSAALTNLVSSGFEFLVLIPLMVVFGIPLSAAVPLFLVLHVVYFFIVYGLGLILASLYVYYRDLNQIWEVLLQLGFFMCPILYPISVIPPAYLGYYMLNPIARLMGMYRDIFLEGSLPDAGSFVYVATVGVVLLVVGNIVFSRLSPRFAEEI